MDLSPARQLLWPLLQRLRLYVLTKVRSPTKAIRFHDRLKALLPDVKVNGLEVVSSSPMRRKEETKRNRRQRTGKILGIRTPRTGVITHRKSEGEQRPRRQWITIRQLSKESQARVPSTVLHPIGCIAKNGDGTASLNGKVNPTPGQTLRFKLRPRS